MDEFALQFNATIATQYDESVTHLVVTLPKSNILKQRTRLLTDTRTYYSLTHFKIINKGTMKYMQSLMHGIWIVSSEWMAESIEHNAVLIEEKYEVVNSSKATMDHAPRLVLLCLISYYIGSFIYS